jgi:hypothetical protein
MSMAALSTELNARIIEYLHETHDRRALWAMSLVSRYYNILKEPFLYRTIAIDDKLEVRIKRLMITLLDRNKLGHHIKSIAVSAPLLADCSSTELENVTRALRQYVGKDKIAVRDVDSDQEYFNRHWVAAVIERRAHHDTWRPNMDGALAIVFAFAVNIEKAHLTTSSDQPLRITREVIAWYNVSAGKASVCEKLADVEFVGTSPNNQGLFFQLPAGAQRVLVLDRNIVSLEPALSPLQALRKLEIHNVTMHPKNLRRLLQDPASSKLEYLSLDNLRRYDEWLDTNHAKVCSCLCKNQTNLKVLRFVGVAMKEEQWPRGLGSLQSLAHSSHTTCRLRPLDGTGRRTRSPRP